MKAGQRNAEGLLRGKRISVVARKRVAFHLAHLHDNIFRCKGQKSVSLGTKVDKQCGHCPSILSSECTSWKFLTEAMVARPWKSGVNDCSAAQGHKKQGRRERGLHRLKGVGWKTKKDIKQGGDDENRKKHHHDENTGAQLGNGGEGLHLHSNGAACYSAL